AYYYQYTVTINYVDNFVPNLTIVSPTNNQTLSEVPGHNKLTISGTVQDTDAGDTLTVKYQIDSATAQSIQTLTATGSSQTINNYDILIDSSISEGNHVLKVWAEDDKGGSSSVVTRNFTVDKTPPAAPTITESPTGNAPNKTITISYSGDTVTKEYQVDSGAWTAYTSPFSITQNGTITARATDAAGNQSTNQLVVSTINPPAPTVTVSGVSNTGFTVTDTGTYTAPVEYQFELYAVGNPTPIATYPSTTTWQDGNSYTFSSLNPNVKYQAKVKVRYK
ncbi:hypothetical protein QO009_004120, partial [Brevibacillus aydinogluensis]|uniref:OmpL47-type beta-barrel domain-containing protein n=1 Tax=Brevibacillus aydinogluensis TaxID=927786 RepID=UPI002894D07E|nr:hypothetical protein [Brevibacillus aydinogluensis]